MSDVTVAPAATPSAPPASEVPVNESPVTTPAPISGTPPPAPEKTAPSAQERAVGRRESIERGFKKSEAAQDDKLGQRQRPGMGHNQPPEPMQPERQRGEHGHFAPRQADAGQPGQQAQPGQPAEPYKSPYQPLPRNAPYSEPPKRMRFSERASADWHGTPESVRGAVSQTFQEMEQGIQQYRPAAEAFHEIYDFHELAGKHGTTLRTALTNYVGMESKLREDLIGGLDQIVNNLGLTVPTENGGQYKITLRDVAYHILNMSPDQHRITAAQNRTQAQQMQMGQLHQTVESLANTVGQMQYEQTYGRTLSAVDHFADQHPRFDELADVIKYELQFGFSLDEAYARADRLYPATGRNGGTHAAQTRNTHGSDPSG